MKEKMYFRMPTQVAFREEANPDKWVGGIGLGYEIICGCCGGQFGAEDIIEYKELGWLDLDQFIVGDANIDLL